MASEKWSVSVFVLAQQIVSPHPSCYEVGGIAKARCEFRIDQRGNPDFSAWTTWSRGVEIHLHLPYDSHRRSDFNDTARTRSRPFHPSS